jgi:hypothetical protein
MRSTSYLVDVLALELTDELEDLLDVAGGRRGVTTKAEEKVCRKVLHFDGWLMSLVKNRSSIDLTCGCQYESLIYT